MSYLAWPVAINGQITNERGKPLHMSLKFMGNVNWSTAAIAKALSVCDLTPVGAQDKPQWDLVVFEHAGFTFNVMELLNPPKRLVEAREALKQFREDDFPTYRPHITLDKHHWEFLNASNRGRIMIEIGPLALMGLV